MSLYYKFVTEVEYRGEWKGIGWRMTGPDGINRPRYNCSINAHDLGVIEEWISTKTLEFDELAAETQETILDGYLRVKATDLDGNPIPVNIDDVNRHVRNRKYYQMDAAGIDKIFKYDKTSIYKHSGFVKVFTVMQYVMGLIDQIDEYLDADEYEKLPDKKKSTYTYFMWNYLEDKVEIYLVHKMGAIMNEQLESFRALYEQEPQDVRIIVDIS